MMTKINRAWGTTALGAAAGMAAVASPSQGQQAVYPAPTFDRWMYPFNSQPGVRPDALIFGVLGPQGVGQFDDRDGQLLVTWSTGGEFQPGLGAANYRVLSARVTATIDPRFGDAFFYDPTIDSFRTYLDPNDPDYLPDSDPGRPIELFGTGFRNGFTPASFGESGPFSFAPPTGEGVRNAFALDRSGVDASNNVRDRFEALPMAVGATDLAPGSLVPGGQTMVFDLDVNDPLVAAYLGAGLSDGFLSFTLTSLHEGSFAGPATFPVFMTKESTLPGATPATLELSVEIVPAPAAGSLLLAAMGARAGRRRRSHG